MNGTTLIDLDEFYISGLTARTNGQAEDPPLPPRLLACGNTLKVQPTVLTQTIDASGDFDVTARANSGLSSEAGKLVFKAKGPATVIEV